MITKDNLEELFNIVNYVPQVTEIPNTADQWKSACETTQELPIIAWYLCYITKTIDRKSGWRKKNIRVLVKTEGLRQTASKKIEQIITEIATKELSEQKQILETELDNWQDNEKQRDDITVIGIKL